MALGKWWWRWWWWWQAPTMVESDCSRMMLQSALISRRVNIAISLQTARHGEGAAMHALRRKSPVCISLKACLGSVCHTPVRSLGPSVRPFVGRSVGLPAVCLRATNRTSGQPHTTCTRGSSSEELRDDSTTTAPAGAPLTNSDLLRLLRSLRFLFKVLFGVNVRD